MAKKKKSIEKEYEYYMQLAKEDPIRAGKEFLVRLRKKPTRRTLNTIRQLERILSGDETAWHASARSLTDAIQLIISNSLFKGPDIRMGVIYPEDNVATVANIISDDIDIDPLTPLQKRMKVIAESYGFVAYQLD